MRTEKKQRLAQLRRWRVRQKVNGTKERPRMSVCFTNEHIYVQFIDDHAGATLAAASTRGKATPAAQDASRPGSPFSTTSTRSPCLSSSIASASPMMPAPTTIASQLFTPLF